MNGLGLSQAAQAIRGLRRSPRLTAAIVACVAIAVGGAATVLTFLWGILWRPLPFPLLTVAGILLVTATAICLLSAWRAAHIEPTQALRSE